MELMCENSLRAKHIVCLHRKVSPQISHLTPNADPTRRAVNLGVGGLQVHAIGSCRLVYKEVVGIRSN